MGTRLSIAYEVALLSLALLLHAVILSCAPATIALSTLPDNHKGPIAERPILQQGDYWVYERGNLTKVKTTALATNIGFPLWIGKTWSYEGQGLPLGQMSPTSKRFRVPTRIDCNVVAFKEIALTVGTFAAFECECRCTVTGSAGSDPWCGDWTIWYAPEVKNIIRRKTESTETSVELVEYKTSRASPSPKVSQERAPVPPEPKFEPTLASTRRALLRGEIKEALASYETQAKRAEEAAAHAASPEKFLRAAVSNYGEASRAARLSGQAQKSIGFAAKALELAEKTKSPGLWLRAADQMILAYRIVRDFESARALVDKGLEVVKQLPDDSYSRVAWEANVYERLGNDLLNRRNYEEAIDTLSKSLNSSKERLDRVSTIKGTRGVTLLETARIAYVQRLKSLGSAYRGAGRLGEALEQYQRAFEFINAWGLNYPYESDLYWNMGDIHRQQRSLPQALETFSKALAIAERQGRPASITSASLRIGDVLREMGKPAEAIPHYEKSIRQIESTRSLLDSEEYRQSFFEGGLGTYVNMMRALRAVGTHEETFNYSERARSRGFLDVLGSRVQLSKVKGGLLEEERTLNERIAAIKARLEGEGTEAGTGTELETERETLRKELTEAEKAYNAFLGKVRKQDKEQASLMSVEPLTLKEIQELLDPDTTLIEYFVTGPNIYVWVIDKKRMQYLGVQIPKKVLTDWVRTLRETIFTLGEREKFNEVSLTLYQLLIQRVLPYVRGRELIIVPHDVLHYLPFHALLSPDRRYLIEKYPIYYLSSASLLQFVKEKRRAGGENVLAFGNPDLGDPTKNLEFAELEAREIRAVYPEAAVLVKKEATEEKSKALSPKHDILHFATHAELNEDDPLLSAVLLAKSDKEDGRLEVREIFGMDLKASLVVLSACETGLGKLSSGDELVGLTRAFIYAGTPSVVASLWKVEDSSTAQLMANFYKNLRTMSKVGALRQAQLQLIRGDARSDLLARRGIGGIGKLGEVPAGRSLSQDSISTSHPYFWAPFILVGDGK